MSEQADFQTVPVTRHNRTPLFFALLLRTEDRPAMERFAQACRHAEGLTGTLTPAGRLHVSLHLVGNYSELPDHIVRASLTAGASIDDVPAFSVAFDRTMTFTSKDTLKPFVICAGDGMTALERLHERLGRALWKVGLGRCVARRSTPHMTLLYDRRSAAERFIPAVTLRFDGFVLVHSLVDPRRHVHVARWPLRQ